MEEKWKRHDGSPAHAAAGHCPSFLHKVKGQNALMIISKQDLHCTVHECCHPVSVATIHPVEVFLPSLRDSNVRMEGVTAMTEYRHSSGTSIVLWYKNLFFFYPSDCQSPLFSPCCFPLFPLVLFLYLTFLFLQFPLILHPYPLSQSLSPSSLSNPACLINFPSHDSSLQHSVCPNLGVGGGNYHFYASSVRFCQI